VPHLLNPLALIFDIIWRKMEPKGWFKGVLEVKKIQDMSYILMRPSCPSGEKMEIFCGEKLTASVT